MSDCAMVMEFLSGIALGLSGAMVGGVILFIVITWLAKR
jgi:hypothetical protein